MQEEEWIYDTQGSFLRLIPQEAYTASGCGMITVDHPFLLILVPHANV
jgi:hypothetical protein